MMNVDDFLMRLKMATGKKTLYVKGAFGAPASAANKQRYATSNDYNKNRAQMILGASSDTFFFDCVNLIKGILWGWVGDVNAQYGGAIYASNGVPDIGEDEMILRCKNVSSDFTDPVPGAMLWNPGHAGVYIGDGLAIECTPSWKNGVQTTSVGNMGRAAGYPSRKWASWGLLPYVDYDKVVGPTSQEEFNKMMDVWLAQQREKPASNYATDALEWAVDNELLFGDATGNLMPQSLIKRQDVIVILKRFFDTLC